MSISGLSESAVLALALLVSSCAPYQVQRAEMPYAPGTGPGNKLSLPAPFATPSVRNTSKIVGWPKGKMPTAAPGFEVSLFDEDFDNPRQADVLPNGDILIVEAMREWIGRADRPEKSANRITLLRDTKIWRITAQR